MTGRRQISGKVGEVMTTIAIVSLAIVTLGIYLGSRTLTQTQKKTGFAQQPTSSVCDYGSYSQIRYKGQILTGVSGFGYHRTFPFITGTPIASLSADFKVINPQDKAEVIWTPPDISTNSAKNQTAVIELTTKEGTKAQDYQIVGAFCYDLDPVGKQSSDPLTCSKFCQNKQSQYPSTKITSCEYGMEKAVAAIDGIRVGCGGRVQYGWNVLLKSEITPIPTTTITPTPTAVCSGAAAKISGHIEISGQMPTDCPGGCFLMVNLCPLNSENAIDCGKELLGKTYVGAPDWNFEITYNPTKVLTTYNGRMGIFLSRSFYDKDHAWVRLDPTSNAQAIACNKTGKIQGRYSQDCIIDLNQMTDKCIISLNFGYSLNAITPTLSIFPTGSLTPVPTNSDCWGDPGPIGGGVNYLKLMAGKALINIVADIPESIRSTSKIRVRTCPPDSGDPNIVDCTKPLSTDWVYLGPNFQNNLQVELTGLPLNQEFGVYIDSFLYDLNNQPKTPGQLILMHAYATMQIDANVQNQCTSANNKRLSHNKTTCFMKIPDSTPSCQITYNSYRISIISPTPTKTPTLSPTRTPTPSPTITPWPTATLIPTATPTIFRPSPTPTITRQSTTDPNFKIAIVGAQQALSLDRDQSEQKRVLDLVRSESAQALILLGDLRQSSCNSDFLSWKLMMEQKLPQNFPIFAVPGRSEWQGNCRSEVGWEKYRVYLTERLKNMSQVNCVTSPGSIVSKCSIKGLDIFLSGYGSIDGQSDESAARSFFNEALLESESLWKICGWARPRPEMQLGSTNAISDGFVSWVPYELCKNNGAIIISGHEQSYARTKTLSNMQYLVPDSMCQSDTSCRDGKEAWVGKGRSFATVVGTGGSCDRRPQLRCLDTTRFAANLGNSIGNDNCGGRAGSDIWASVYSSVLPKSILDSGGKMPGFTDPLSSNFELNRVLSYINNPGSSCTKDAFKSEAGALFMTFNTDNDPKKATAYFKTVSGSIKDQYTIYKKDQTGGPNPTINPSMSPRPTAATSSSRRPVPSQNFFVKLNISNPSRLNVTRIEVKVCRKTNINDCTTISKLVNTSGDTVSVIENLLQINGKPILQNDKLDLKCTLFFASGTTADCSSRTLSGDNGAIFDVEIMSNGQVVADAKTQRELCDIRPPRDQITNGLDFAYMVANYLTPEGDVNGDDTTNAGDLSACYRWIDELED